MSPLLTNIRLKLSEPSAPGPVLALASVKVADAVHLNGIRVLRGKHGIYVGMPQHRTPTRQYVDTYFCASKMVRDQLEKMTLDAYKAATTAPEPLPPALQ